MNVVIKRIITLLCAISAAAALYAQPRSDKEILADIKDNPYCCAGGYCPYYAPQYMDTPAPEGYKPFYVSHIGRHGSRYQTSFRDIDRAVAMLDTLHFANLLTCAGDSLRDEIHHIKAAHYRMESMLTGKGTREHMQIAANLVKRCPEVFHQNDRPGAWFTSTAVARTIQSMAGFSSAIVARAPQLDVHISSGFPVLNFGQENDERRKDERQENLVKGSMKALSPSQDDYRLFLDRILTDGQKASGAIGNKTLDLLANTVLAASAGAGCLDIEVEPLRFFTPEELFAFYKFFDVEFNGRYGTLTAGDIRSGSAIKWAHIVVDDADAAMQGNGHCADFRFAHDGTIGPLMRMLGIGPFQWLATPQEPFRNWQSYRSICMGTNLQLIFYKADDGGDILVKALYNEREIDFPGLDATCGVYYKWKDVRRYILERCGDAREVPQYYAKYLKAKSAQIAALQKDEADGFYFITDTHFPANFGNSPALVESLENTAGRRMVVFGGDIVTYLDDMKEAFYQQISAFEQIKGAAPLLWVRGNHDMVNYTGRKSYITKPRKALYQWDAAGIISRFRPQRSISNPADPYSAYFYYDNKDAGIRYIVIESTDRVSDNQIKYGISDTQIDWIVREAVLGAPHGYHLVFFSHVPPADAREKSIADVADMLSAVKSHGRYAAAGRTYDFSSRPDLEVIAIVCGHKHKDYDKVLGSGVLQVNVDADCNYDRQKYSGTVNEQSFEYFSISKDFKTIRTVKIGAGRDRTFRIR